MGFFIPKEGSFNHFFATNFQGKGEDEASGQMVIFHQPRFLLKWDFPSKKLPFGGPGPYKLTRRITNLEFRFFSLSFLWFFHIFPAQRAFFNQSREFFQVMKNVDVGGPRWWETSFHVVFGEKSKIHGVGPGIYMISPKTAWKVFKVLILFQSGVSDFIHQPGALCFLWRVPWMSRGLSMYIFNVKPSRICLSYLKLRSKALSFNQIIISWLVNVPPQK